jgi:hypothetical protein
MTHFILTFRIASDSTYNDRYKSFTETVTTLAGGSGKVWDETTAFYAFKADGTAASVTNHLYLQSQFDATKDTMVVVDLDSRAKATKGPLKWESLLTAYLGF